MDSEQFCVEQNTEIEDVNLTDYMYLIIASIISSCGFVLDSETIVIGSITKTCIIPWLPDWNTLS